MKMRYSIEPKDFCLLRKICVQIQAVNMVKKFLIVQKKSTTYAIKTLSRRAFQKAAEAAGDLIGNKIADKITSVSKKSKNKENNDELETPKERYISPEKRQQIIDELRLA